MVEFRDTEKRINEVFGMATIGQIIRNERTKKGLTQEELGKYLGIQKSAVAKMENGRTESVKRSQHLFLRHIF